MMLPVIKFNPVDFNRIIRAIDRLKRMAPVRLDRTQGLMAVDYKNLVIKNIVRGTFDGGYASYTERYEKWKRLFSTNVGYHILKGDAIKAISVQLVKKTKWTSRWFSGIPSGIMDTGGKSWFFPLGQRGKPKSIAMTMYVSEYGGNYGAGGKHPARPVFGPSEVQYSRNGWLVRANDFLKAVRRDWR